MPPAKRNPQSSLALYLASQKATALERLEDAVLLCQAAGIKVGAMNLYPAVGKHIHSVVLGETYSCKACSRLKFGETPDDEICPECKGKVFSKNGKYPED